MAVSGSGIRISQTPTMAIIEQRSGQKVRSCYQCGNCTASCPASYAMDYTPRQVMRALQLGQLDDALKSSTIWVCLSCQTCVVRCPREIEPAKVMDTLRQMAVERGIKPRESDIYTFHKSFLQLVKMGGRLYEAGLVGMMNLRTGRPLANMNVGLPMLAKRKVGLVPSRAKGTAAVNRIFDKVAKAERKQAASA
ncbi:MAG: 4Fe-4S dicluster domain-containing protein [Chloroflexota bacterium]